MLIWITRLRQCSSGFSTVKLLSFPPFHTVLFGRKPLCAALDEGVHLLEDEASAKIVWNSSSSLFSPFIYLLNHLFISIDSLIFILYFGSMGYNPTLLYFVLKQFQLWPLGALLFDSCVLLTYPVTMLFFFFWTTSLLSGTTRCSRFILYISYPSPRVRHFSKELWFRLLENDLGTFLKVFKGVFIHTLLSHPQPL